MITYKVLDNIKQASYFNKPTFKSEDDEFESQRSFFTNDDKISFLAECEKFTNFNQQGGYSKSKECDYLALIVIGFSEGDMTFLGNSIYSTFLINKDAIIKDIYMREDGDGGEEDRCETSFYVTGVYHPLPDGKLIEYPITIGYKQELQSIYEVINEVRKKYTSNNKLPENITIEPSNKKLKF